MARFASLDPDSRRKLEITLAVAGQRALDIHVRQALELVTHAHGRVGMRRALAIYGRIHGLPGEDERVLNTRVLAALGQADLRPGDAEVPEGGPVARVLRRLRGRRDLQLRRWVEFHKGRTDRNLIDVHVDAIARIHESFPDESSVAEAVAWYAEAVRLSGSLRDSVYLAALARLDDTGRHTAVRDGVLAHPETHRPSGGTGADSAPQVGRRYRAFGD
jgi:hypothetical protein